MSFVKVVNLLLSILTATYTIYVVGRLTLFLSAPRSISKAHTWIFNLLDNKSRLETAYGPIVWDVLYVIGFIYQHSVVKSAFVKSLLRTLGLATAERTIYVLTSSLCLHYLLRNWLPAQSIVLWQIDVEENSALWWTFVTTHVLSWTIIYGGSIIMDLPELLGVKQAYNSLNDCPDPITYKAVQLRNLYAHVRHPSFLGFTIILFATNVMSIDRLALAVLLTTYMYVAWSTDKHDVEYQKKQLQRKKLKWIGF